MPSGLGWAQAGVVAFQERTSEWERDQFSSLLPPSITVPSNKQKEIVSLKKKKKERKRRKIYSL